MNRLSGQLMGRAAELLPWMADDAVTDILINGTQSLFVERAGKLQSEPNPFPDRLALADFIERLSVPTGRRIDAAQPFLDGRLVDGSRFHVILPPLAPDGPIISIRKLKAPGDAKLRPFANPEISLWLEDQVKARRNILIAGGTGTGKTTLLTQLLSTVSEGERIAVIEEAMEIRTGHPHAIHLEARPASPDGKGEVTLRTLLRNALRMRPDRIVLGECRGNEVFEMLQAMNTGHPGSLCTVHANGALDALRRLEALMLFSAHNISLRAAREWIAAGIQLVVFLQRKESHRFIDEVLSVNGLEGEVFRITPIVRAGARHH